MSEKPQHPSGAQVTARYKQALFGSVATYYAEPVALERGAGALLFDHDGRSYLDFFGGILTVGLGQNHPRVNAAVRAQLDRLGHVSSAYPTLPVAELAEKLTRLAPGKHEKAFFCTSGSEADETAVALAQSHTGHSEIVALRHGYSGRTLLGQALTGHAAFRLAGTQVAAVKHAHAPYCYRCPFGLTYPSCELRCAQDVEELIATTTTGTIAGAVLEPVLGVGGFITPPPGWMKLVVDIVRRHGGVFICDEVQTGFGRTGALWGVEHEGLAPDIVTMAKGIANGFPIAAVVTSAPIAAAWRAGNISTFGGNPICAAAANATVDTIVEEGLVENARAMGERLRAGLERLKEKHSAVGDVRGRGLMQGLEIVRNEKTGDRAPAADTTLKILEETKRRGLLVGRGGLYANTLRVAPPLIVTSAQIDDALAALDESLAVVRP